MYFLDLKGLINQHVEKGIAPREQFKYVFGFALLGLIGRGAPAQRTEMPNVLIVIFVLAALAGILFFVINHFYKKNGGDNGQDFILRLFTISWVITWRLCLTVFPILLLLMLLAVYALIEPRLILAIALLMSVGSILYYLAKMSQSLEEIHAGDTFLQRPAENTGRPDHGHAVGIDQRAVVDDPTQLLVPACLDELVHVDHHVLMRPASGNEALDRLERFFQRKVVDSATHQLDAIGIHCTLPPKGKPQSGAQVRPDA